MQIEAEIDAAKCFTCHPSMATLVATCFDEKGNFFSVSPYMGCTLTSIIEHPNWFKSVSAKDRLEFVRVMLLQMMTVFDTMQSTISTQQVPSSGLPCDQQDMHSSFALLSSIAHTDTW